jgi:hypothetical protein
MNAINWILLIFLGAVTTACGGGGGGSGNPNNSALLVQSISSLNVNGLNGNGNIVVMSYTDTSSPGSTTGFKETLKIYKQDSVNPDFLLDLSSVYLGVDTLYHRVSDITLNDQWATVTINFNLSADQGWVALVPMAGPAYSLSVTLSFDATLDRAIAMGNWLLVASTTELAIYDITIPAAPVFKASFMLTAGTTSLAASTNGFFVITNNGYGYVDVSDPANVTYAETANVDIKQSKKAYLIGTKLYIGGPSKFAGKMKIARLDVTTPGAPAVEIINDQINGTFVDFGYDGVGGYYLQLTDSVMLFKEVNSALSLSTSASLMSSARSVSQFYAHKNRFYSANSGLNIYKMP